MSYLLRGASLMTLDPVSVEHLDLRVDGWRVAERGAQLEARPDEEVIDLSGKLVMPGMVCAHTHLYSTLARGMPPPPRSPSNFKEILELIWWRLDSALDEETIYWSALAGALNAARSGTTCFFDHHASPSCISGSLQTVREAVAEVGLRGVLCYEVTDRGGGQRRDKGLDENRAFLQWANRRHAETGNETAEASRQALFRGMIGAHASFTLSDDSVRACAELAREFDAGLHIHVAEDFCDVEDAHTKYGVGIVERLAKYNALTRGSILAHGTHLDGGEISIAQAAGVWFAHNPRSNMNNRVGYAPVAQFGDKLVLGTDGIGADMFEEARFAFSKNRDADGSLGAGDWLRALANNQRMASEIFGIELATFEAGSGADLIVLEDTSPTPITAENLAWHLMFGLNSASVESVMVNGEFVVRDRRPALDAGYAYAEARKASERLWARLREM